MLSYQGSAPQEVSDLRYGDFRSIERSSLPGFPREEMFHQEQGLHAKSKASSAANTLSGHHLQRINAAG